MTDSLQRFTDELHRKIEKFQTQYTVQSIGTVLEAGDGIAQVEGLAGIHSQELVEFSNGVIGIAFNLEKSRVGVIILGDYSTISEGMQVHATGRIASVPVGDGLIGRVVNAAGEPIDGKGSIEFSKYRPIERIAPGVIERKDVDSPVQTGLKAIDAMIPVGRGQRELIIGDRQTGKSAIAIDTIINQRGKDLICIYVAIGQKKAAVARTIGILEQFGAMGHTIVLVAAADEPAAMQYIAPYAGCAIGEEIMESGRDALIIYDDLSKHAWAYRQLSLMLRRPPGREAYPGDVFYLHSRLLERAACMANQYVILPKDYENELAQPEDFKDAHVYDGPRSLLLAQEALKETENAKDYKIVKVQGTGGSLTALPIIETLLGDVSAYIPTNVISITDGQIYLEGNLFNAGIRPAINVGISVSRVGGSAQTKAMKQVAGRLRLDMAAYRELAAFAQFGSDLDKATMAQLTRGIHLQEILKQPQYTPMSPANEIIVLYAGTNGYADEVAPDRMKSWETGLLRFIETGYPDISKNLVLDTKITPEIEETLKGALQAYTATWQRSG